MSQIRVVGIARSKTAQTSADRMALLLESAILESSCVQCLEATLHVSRFENRQEIVRVAGPLVGAVNSKEFDLKFERSYTNLNDSHWKTAAQSPLFGLCVMAYKAVSKERDPIKNLENWLTRAEFESVSRLESRINRIVGAPLDNVRSGWRNALYLALVCQSLAFIAMLFRLDGPIGIFGIAMLGIVLCFPAGFGGVFLGLLLFQSRNIEESIGGQSLLRLVGVKTIVGLRVVSVIGTIMGFGLFLTIYFAAKL